MTNDEARQLALGLYRLHWIDGGSSFASVGQTYSGRRWYAPVNWTAADADEPLPGMWPLVKVASTDWSKVDQTELLYDHETD